jgi:hypothetical protein
VPDDDSAWKEILDRYLRDFFQFFFPGAYRDIDWSRRPIFLDKELQAVLRGAPRGRQYVDKLVKVRLRAGDEPWILIHVEIEGRAGPDFTKRMERYNARIAERYGQEVVSLALLTHAGARHHLEPYDHERWGFRRLFRFPAVKISSYRGKEERLQRSRNPFALLVLAHLKREEARRDAARKLSVKKDLVRLLHERGYERNDIIHLFRFLDWLVRLPPELDGTFEAWISDYEKRKTMPYVTSIERIGRKRGRREGRKEGREEGRREGLQAGLQEGLVGAVEAVLEARFGRKGVLLLSNIDLPRDSRSLRDLHRDLLDLHSLSEAAARIGKVASRAGRRR